MTSTTKVSVDLNKSLPQKQNSVNELQIIEKDGIQAVSARELYKGLEISKRFSEWFSINSKDFIEGEDFTSVLTSTLVNNGAKREIQDYAISIDMAKSICLMSRTEIGKTYRNYLIKLEKAWNTPEAVMSRALQLANKTLDNIKHQVAIMQPKAVVYDELVDRSKTMNFRDMAAKLGFTQTEFMAILKAKYVYKNSIGEYRARAEYQKYFTLRTFNKSTDKTGEQLLLNMEGITYFINKYKPGAVADSFIEKGEEEYQKIINKTSEKFIESVESHSYTLKEASVILDIPENMIKEYLQIRHFADFTGKKTILANEYIDDENKITEKGIERLRKAFDIYLKTKKGTYYNPNGECNGKEE